MTWIQTYSGVQFWPLQPRAEDVRLLDIAHALSLTCRFNGHCSTFYSVAQHSVLVAEEVCTRGLFLDSPPKVRENGIRAALLHDAAEAYLSDVCRPIKPLLVGYQEIEKRLSTVILEALSVWVSPELELIIKYRDNVLLATEARDLMGPHPAAWVELPPPMKATIQPWSPAEAEARFLSWFPVEAAAAGKEGE
jgi:hypothetical protein